MTKHTTLSLGGITLGVVAAAAALLLFASSAFAAGTLSGDTQTVAAGGTAHVTISGAAVAPAGVGNWTIDVAVDAAKLGAAACTASNSAGDCNVLAGNVVRFAGAAGSEAGITGTVTFGTVDVTAQAALVAGSCSDLTITFSKFQDGAGADLGPTVTNGKVCIEAAATNSPAATTAAALPKTGGPSSDSSFQLGWLAAAAGALIVVAAGAWTFARAREDS